MRLRRSEPDEGVTPPLLLTIYYKYPARRNTLGWRNRGRFTCPEVPALDGEREMEIRLGQRLQIRVSDSGPRVVDAHLALRLAAERGFLVWHGPS